jgi:BlaI family transcriptional regulator, penicillinase repressor
MDGQVELSRRERQIMDVVYGRGEASATDVLAGIADPPGRAAVRTMLRILESKGHLKHYKKGREFIYQPTRPRGRVARSVLTRVLDTFFSGSIEQALAAHLADPEAKVSSDELHRLAKLIRQAREKGK